MIIKQLKKNKNISIGDIFLFNGTLRAERISNVIAQAI